MPLGFTDFKLETLRLLNEPSDSVIAELPDGIGGTTTSSDNVLIQYINDAAYDLCRTCVYVPTSIAIASHTGRTYDYDSSLMINPFVVKVDSQSAPLIHCGEPELQNYDLTYTIVTGSPTHWYEAGYNNIGFYPSPTTPIAITVTGAGVPSKISTSSGTYSFISDDLLLRAIPAYVAKQIALKNYDDPSIVGRQFWGDMYDQIRLMLWTRLDPSFKGPNGIFSVPPVVAGGGK